MVNYHLVCNPTIRQQSFDLPRQQWSLLNRFRTEQGHCIAMATYRHWSVSLWRDSDDVPYCQILSSDKVEWHLIKAALCRWRRCFLADQLWFMTRIREEDIIIHNSLLHSFKQTHVHGWWCQSYLKCFKTLCWWCKIHINTYTNLNNEALYSM